MITKKTALILGAGASRHLDYPLGKGLVQRIQRIQYNKGELAKLDEMVSGQPRRECNFTGFEIGDLRAFISTLNKAQPDSMDDHLAKYNECGDVEVGKFLIAYALTECEDQEKLHGKPGWYNTLLQAIRPIDDLADKALSIVTFNYDRSLDVYLHDAIHTDFIDDKTSANLALHKIPIIHLHGQFGNRASPAYEPITDIESLTRLSTGIHIVGEQSVDTDFAHATMLLREAKRIYFLGFGFHPVNIDRFNFFNRDSMRDIEHGGTLCSSSSVYTTKLLDVIHSRGLDYNQFLKHSTCDDFFDKVALG
jgi:hypothetical protein